MRYNTGKVRKGVRCPVGNFLYRMKCGMARFMYGRNGTDQLNIALLLVYLLLVILRSIAVGITGSAAVDLIFAVVTLVMAAWILFRIFSRNLTRRREENARFLRRVQPMRGRVARLRDRDHRYFTCPGCKTVCRVPRGKGTIRITCPKCGNVMQKRT